MMERRDWEATLPSGVLSVSWNGNIHLSSLNKVFDGSTDSHKPPSNEFQELYSTFESTFYIFKSTPFSHSHFTRSTLQLQNLYEDYCDYSYVIIVSLFQALKFYRSSSLRGIDFINIIRLLPFLHKKTATDRVQNVPSNVGY